MDINRVVVLDLLVRTHTKQVGFPAAQTALIEIVDTSQSLIALHVLTQILDDRLTVPAGGGGRLEHQHRAVIVHQSRDIGGEPSGLSILCNVFDYSGVFDDLRRQDGRLAINALQLIRFHQIDKALNAHGAAGIDRLLDPHLLHLAQDLGHGDISR